MRFNCPSFLHFKSSLIIPPLKNCSFLVLIWLRHLTRSTMILLLKPSLILNYQLLLLTLLITIYKIAPNWSSITKLAAHAFLLFQVSPKVLFWDLFSSVCISAPSKPAILPSILSNTRMTQLFFSLCLKQTTTVKLFLVKFHISKTGASVIK